MVTITRPTITKEYLQKLYWEEGLSLAKIGQLTNRSYGTIRDYFVRLSIPLRPKGGHVGQFSLLPDLTSEQLNYLYHSQGLTVNEIAKRFGVHYHTIQLRMQRWGITTRSRPAHTANAITRRIKARASRKTQLFDSILGKPEPKNFQITPEYIVGLTDGEGSFTFYIDFRKSPPVTACEFSISNTNMEALQEVKNYFGFGVAYPGGHKAGVYRARKFGDVLRIARFFCDHPPKIKQRQFKIWLHVLRLISEHKHVTEAGFREILYLREANNEYSP